MSTVDVAVIGGGFAGLSAAVHLAAAGARVCLLEQDDAPGGKAGEVRVDGFRFDTGPSVFTLPEVFAGVFEAAGRSSPLELTPLDLLCRYEFASGRVWNVYRDVGRTVAQLDPTEADVYVRLLGEAQRLFRASSETFVFGSAPGARDLVRFGLRSGLRAHPHRSLRDLLRAFGARGDLETFFLRFATYVGANPFRAPAVLHNIAWVELGMGVTYPAGGIRAAVDALVDLARDLGVDVRTGTEVHGLDVAGGRIRGVKTGSSVLEPRFVISAVDRTQTLQWLERRVPPDAATSLSGFVLLLGVRGARSRLAHHTIRFPRDYPAEFAAIRRGELPADPTLYLHLGCRQEPADAPEGAENWFVMTNAPPLAAADTSARAAAREQEAEYAALLESRLASAGLLEGREVVVRRRRTPSDLVRYGHRGAIYGRAPHSLLRALRPPQQVRGVDNLALAGGTVYPGGGIPLALLSGREAARLALAKGSARAR